MRGRRVGGDPDVAAMLDARRMGGHVGHHYRPRRPRVSSER